MDSLCVAAPSKLFLCGEYAVLDAACPAYVMAVEPYYQVSAQVSDVMHIQAHDLDASITGQWCEASIQWDQHDTAYSKLNFARAAVDFSMAYVSKNSLKPLTLTLTIQRQAQAWHAPIECCKGLGSSAAVCVGVVAAILVMHGFDIEAYRKTIFELAYQAHFQSQAGRGSGADVAASVFGGVLRYQSPGAYGVMGEQLPLEMAVAWSGQAASTTHMVGRIQSALENHEHDQARFIKRSQLAGTMMQQALEQQDSSLFLQAIAESHAALSFLQQVTQETLYTPALHALVEIAQAQGAQAKLSGAGGGDHAIAFFKGEKRFSPSTSKAGGAFPFAAPPALMALRHQLYDAWKEQGLVPLPIERLAQGVHLV